MKLIVIYESKTGFTKQYAEWIASELNCETVPVKKCTVNLDEYDYIIYGEPFISGYLRQLDKFYRKEYRNKLIVFTTGVAPMERTYFQEHMWEGNLTSEDREVIPFFYMQAGIDFEHMPSSYRRLVEINRNGLKEKEDKTVQDELMYQHLTHSEDYSKKEYIQPLVDYVRGLEK